jgi:hypothetical protein
MYVYVCVTFMRVFERVFVCSCSICRLFLTPFTLKTNIKT